MIVRSIGAACALASGTDGALAVEVAESVTVLGEPAVVWAEIGGFCAIADWHPAVASCEMAEADGATTRTLALEGGGALLEERISDGEAAYGYAILEGPLPVAGYTSELSAAAADGGTAVTWTGSFEAAGATDEEARVAIRGIYRAGLDALAASLR